MKKRVLSMLLVVAMLAAMVVVPAQAESTETQQQTSYYCEHCKADIPAQQWLPWNENNEDPRTGHYYLAEDISDQKSQITISLDDDLNRHKICLDLRGRSYTVTGIRPFLNYGIFSIMDSVGGGEIAVTGATVNANGGFCQMTKHDNAKDGAAELNIYGGTIRKINTKTEVVASGGLIYLANGATLNLHGGKLVGGDVKARTNSAGSVVDPRGGAIYATGANVNICGGTVTGGHAINTTVNDDDVRKAYGGNIYATSGSKVTVSAGSVENGYSDTYGGNLFVGSNSTLEITGGSVTGGYAENAGGNITMSSNSTFKMSDGTLKDGVCVNKGGNLSVDNANAAIEITGGTLYGDLSVGKFKSFKLAGSPKIYMGKGNGLRLQSDENTAKMDISGLTEGAEIYLDGVAQTFTDVLETPDTYLAYFKDAIRADISVDENGALQVAQGTTGFCPHCWDKGKEVTWTAWDNSGTAEIGNDTHYYLADECKRTASIKIANTAATKGYAVFDMAGNTLTTTNTKIFIVYGTNSGKLSLLDSVGGGKMTGTGHANNGGVIMCAGAGVLNMYSGTLSRTVKTGEENKAVRLGGVVQGQSGSEINIYGGTVRDGISATYYSEACKGGNIYAAGTFNMTAGAIIGGKAYTNSEKTDGTALTSNAAGLGGNLYVTRTANISGGHIVDGSAGSGGCIYATSNSALTITGGVIRGGLAYETAGTVDTSKSLDMHGGCIYVAGSSSKTPPVEISDAIIRGGNAREYGANIYTTYADVTIADSVISDGVAGLESGDNGIGGNLFLLNKSTCDLSDTTVGNGSALGSAGNIYVSGTSALTLNSGLICGGNAGENGGNVYGNGFEMKSGIVTGGTSGSDGGNIYTSSGELKIADDGDVKTPAPIVSNATIYLAEGTTGTLTDAVIENANGVHAAGVLNLKGSTNISNEKKGTCVYIAETGSLAVDAGFSGTASVAFADQHFVNADQPHGTALNDPNTAGGVFTGTLLLDGYNDRDYGQPAILAIDGDNKLHIGITAVVDPANDQINWYTDLNEAATKVTEGSYMRLYAEENELTLSGDTVVDLNGKNLTVNGTGKLYGFDTENDDFEGNGTVTATNVEPAFLAPNGRWYVAVTDANGTTFHRMAIRVSNVSLRPSISGVYYKGIWQCDDTLQEKISSFGVAVSVKDAPKDDFASDGDTKYTQFAKEEFENGEAKTSVMIANILKNKADLEDGDSNAVRGAMRIYAAPYVVVKDSAGNDLTIVGEDNNPKTSCVEYNLKEIMGSVDRIWPRLTDVQKNGVKTMYEIDRDELASWNLSNITAEIEDTTSDRPLKILTLGHSLAVDSAYMLNLVAATEGYTNDFEIGTLYYSGCKLYEHVEFLQNDSAEYKLYTSSSKNPNGPPDAINNVTMKEAIQDRDWDIIIMQGGVYENARDESLTNGNIQIIQDYVNQHKTNPNAIFAWHMIWAIPEDADLQATYPNPSTGIFTTYESEFEGSRTVLYNRITEKTEKYIRSDKSFVYLIPSGTAIENALSSYLEEKDLHRDYAHVTDLGRVIAAYTWYCTFAGIHELDEVKLNTIPKAFLKSTADKTQDRVLTEAEKNIILESVNNALANPLQMTQSQYTVAPTE